MPGAFVGREVELEAVGEVVSAAMRAGPMAALVVGDPGCGKTRLLEEATGELVTVHRFQISGYETEREVPLAAASPLLRALARAAEHGETLDRLAFAGDDSGLEPVPVFEAAHRASRELEPAVLAVDDLQWLDSLSLALLTYLLRSATDVGQRLAVIVAARPCEEATSFAGTVRGILGDAAVVELALAGLPREAGIALAQSLSPGLDGVVAAQYWAKARGSPFWLEALIRSGGDEVGAGQLVTARLRGAPSDAGELLGLLVVAGRPLSASDAAQLLAWPAARLEHATRELVWRGIAVEDGRGLRVAHDLVRASALEELPDPTRSRLHRRLAEWLEAEAGEDVQLLRQALAHRGTAGMEAPVLALRLARAPGRRLLGADGVAELSAIADSDPGSDALTLHEAVGALAEEVGEPERAMHHWSVVADRSGDTVRRGAALLEAAKAAAALRRADETMGYLERARALALRDDVFELELDAQECAIRLWREADTEQGRALARTVIARAQELAERMVGRGEVPARLARLQFEMFQLSFDVAQQDSDPEAMLTTAERSVGLARGIDEPAFMEATIALALANFWVARRRDPVETARLAEAEALLRRTWSEAQARVLPAIAIAASEQLALQLAVRGRLEEAEHVARELLALAGRVGDIAPGAVRSARVATEIAVHRGPWREAVARFDQAAAAERNDHLRIAYHQERALALARVSGASHADEVVAALGEAARCATETGCPRCWAELRLKSAEAFARIGRLDEAEVALACWDAAGKEGVAEAAVLRARVSALVTLARGDVELAAGELERIADDAERFIWPLEALWTRLDVAAALVEADRDRAVMELRAVAHRAVELGSRTQHQLAQQRLRALGVRAWTRSRAGEELTAREHEIVRLVSKGASNPEIADTLFLSRKTVERHVSNVLRKVGARNRAELASKVAELEGEGVPR